MENPVLAATEIPCSEAEDELNDLVGRLALPQVEVVQLQRDLDEDPETFCAR